jgi:sugar lactone lactonase YvrE
MTGSGGRSAVELVADARATLGEGPTWDPARRVLWWVDITAGVVHRFDPRSRIDHARSLGSTVGAVAMRQDGTLLIAVAEGLVTLDPDGPGAPGPFLALGTAGDGLRSNDGKCDPAGRLWIGRMAVDAAPGAGTLLSIDRDRHVTTHLRDLAIPNGLGWSPDGTTMYYVDSTWGEVRAYAYDAAAGTLGAARPLVRLAAIEGLAAGAVPDGLSVDAEGCPWVALWGGGCVVRLSPDGAVLDRIAVPVSRVTSCSFGGEDLGDLYITTARQGATAAELGREPLAGGIFRCRPGVRGLPNVPYAG